MIWSRCVRLGNVWHFRITWLSILQGVFYLVPAPLGAKNPVNPYLVTENGGADSNESIWCIKALFSASAGFISQTFWHLEGVFGRLLE